ncbi:hypothetical protein CFIMG_007825RA00001 [Ceratocystis fimbriata CBS 114723]|uniref:Extracellular serine-rich protein n=1 Tax=Ceratocystis fimbriata CBS 114723 TaxID=1035309 RepID=A0A2C5WTW4_9PEZI|nr:hypothetical protein CFIMG_007825RA00001 [Ceratocystis fimbriata CBS 114723]
MRFAMAVLLAATSIKARSFSTISDNLPPSIDESSVSSDRTPWPMPDEGTRTPDDSPSPVVEESITTHTVWVEDTINPDETYAAVGDKVEFHFLPGLYSIVQSDFDSPCDWKSDAIASGPVVTYDEWDTKKVFVIDIEDKEPIWFYNGASGRCHRHGIVGVINPPDNKLLQESHDSSDDETPNMTIFEYFKRAKEEHFTEIRMKRSGGYFRET